MSRKKKTHAEFLAEIKDRPFTALGRYATARTKIQFKCSIDGHEWEAVPYDILRGYGCPKCAGRCGNDVLKDNGTWLLLDISTPKFPTATMAIDADIMMAHWLKGRGRVWVQHGQRGNYIYARYRNSKGSVLMHKDILSVSPGNEVDHIEHGSMTFIDNRRSNLREVTNSQNQMNKGIQMNNSSGIVGVHWHKTDKKWVARISFNGKRIHLGVYDNIDFAVGARQQAEREYFGDFAHRNCNNA